MRLIEISKLILKVSQRSMWLLVIKLILPAVSTEPSVHRGYHATICKDRYFYLLDWISTETWD